MELVIDRAGGLQGAPPMGRRPCLYALWPSNRRLGDAGLEEVCLSECLSGHRRCRRPNHHPRLRTDHRAQPRSGPHRLPEREVLDGSRPARLACLTSVRAMSKRCKEVLLPATLRNPCGIGLSGSWPDMRSCAVARCAYHPAGAPIVRTTLYRGQRRLRPHPGTLQLIFRQSRPSFRPAGTGLLFNTFTFN